MGIAVVSFIFVLYLALRRIFIGPEVEGVFTLFAIAFLLIGLLLFAIGVLVNTSAHLGASARPTQFSDTRSVGSADDS